MTRREIAKFSHEGRRGLPEVRGDARARRRRPRADARRRRRPNLLGRGLGDLWTLLKLGRDVPQARHATGEAVEILTGAGPADPRPLVRVGAAQGDARDRRDHRRVRRAVDAGHRLRAVPPRHGRDATASAACGATSAAAWAASPRRSPAPREGPRRRDPHQRRGGRRSSCKDGARRPASRWPTATSSTPPIVASNADANVTFLKLLDAEATCRRSSSPAIKRIDYASATLKINVALTELPNFTRAARRRRRPAAPRHHAHLPRPGLHRARLRRRQVRPAVAQTRSSNARMPSAVDPTRRARRAST